jgi:hypothetical protein
MRTSIWTSFILFPTIWALAPSSITIISTNITNCNTEITANPSTNHTSLDIVYDTSKVHGSSPDSLASTDSANDTESTCVVCLTLRWSNNLYGRILSLDYDFENRLDPGLLEQIFTNINKQGRPDSEVISSSHQGHIACSVLIQISFEIPCC